MWWWWLVFATRAEVLDRVVAVVEGQPVLASEVAIGVDLARLDPSSRLPPPAGDPTQWAVDTAGVRLLAESVRLYDPTEREVRERIDGLRATYPDRDTWTRFLARHGLDEERLAPLMRRQLVVEKFLLRNIQADPEDAAAWSAEVDALLAVLRERIRWRVVPASPTGAEP